MVATVLASGLGWRLSWFFSRLAPGALSALTIALVYGAILSAGQWLVVRSHVRNPTGWLAATFLGYFLGLWGGVFLSSNLNLDGFRFGLVTGAVFGSAAGTFQAFIFSRQVTKAYIWIPASIFAWSSAFIYYSPSSIWVGGFYGIVSGLVTGTALMWLLYRPAE